MQAIDNPSILIVDDRPENLISLEALLSHFQCPMARAESGEEALRCVLQQDFAVILLDVKMPGMDGFETAEIIRARAQSRHIPIIFLTAYGPQESDASRGYLLGAVDFLFKPIVPEILRSKVGVFLDLHKKTQEAGERAEQLRAAERQRLETELEQARQRLESEKLRAEVETEKAIARELEANYSRLKDLEQLRDDLTNMIVHDLRTPLTAVISGLQTIELAGDLTSEQKELLDMSVSGGRTLLRMISDLLDISKMETGSLEMDRETLSPFALVEQAELQVRSLAKERGIDLRVEIENGIPDVLGDEDKLCRTLVNLLGNALKFTPNNGAVTIRALRPDQERNIVFEIRDTGEGIPEEAFGRIFEKFGQVAGRKSGRKLSTGLGLTFCKMVSEAHGGRIWVESKAGQGSVFRFTVPPAADENSLIEEQAVLAA